MQKSIAFVIIVMTLFLTRVNPASGQLTVNTTVPSNGVTDVAVESNITVTFSGNINTTTVDSSSFTVRGQLFGRFEGAYTFPSGNVAVFNPSSNFLYGEFVEVTLGTDIEASGGGALTEHIFQFFAEAQGASTQTFVLADKIGADASFDCMLGDVNGDGSLDIASAEFNGLRTYLNDGNGRFTSLGLFTPSMGNVDGKASMGDVNGDGYLDVVAAVGGIQDARVWTNDGAGFFGIHQSITPTNLFGGFFNDSWSDVGLGDFDGDGDLDAFFAAQGDVTLANRVYTNDGSGTLYDSGQALGGVISLSVSIGDLDGDGDLDAYVGNSGVADKVYINDGSGTFADSGGTYNNSGFTYGSALGDVDSDGDLDVVLANYGAGNRVLINSGNAVFNDSGLSMNNRNTRDIALGDFDGDGDLDLIACNKNANKEVWTNDGAGVFGDTGQTLDSKRSHTVDLGDVDADGDLDVIFANVASEENYLYFSTGPAPDLDVEKTAGAGTIGTNGAETFLLAITNAGDAAAYGVAVTDTLPAGLSFSAAGSSPECSNENGAVVCRLSSLAVGGAAVFTVAVDAVSAWAGILTNAAACAVTNDEVALYNNDDTATTTVADDDGDGLPDYYEYAQGLDYTNGSDAAENADGDAHDNLAEFIAGTQLTNSQSYFTADTSLSVADYQSVTGHVVRWQGVAGRLYGVSWTDNLNSNYTDLISGIYADKTETMGYTNTTLVTNETAVYYRINVRK